MNPKTRNIVLVVVIFALIVLVLMPGKKRSDTEDAAVKPEAPKAEIQPSAKAKERESARDVPWNEVYISQPNENAVNPLFPLEVGTTWTYKVTGPQRYVPTKKWTMKVASMPAGELPGKLELGFEGDISLADIWITDGSLRIDSLPFTEPLEFHENKPEESLGEMLPVFEKIVQGAVWNQEFKRKVVYRYRDDSGNLKEDAAEAYQRDRAHVEAFENIAVVPAGRFDAWRIYWLSRIDIKIKGRPVLQELTTEPYRDERMWLVPGIGIIRREIDYKNREDSTISFDLISYRRPEK